MPEGPELHLSSLFINDSVKGLIFSGEIKKSDVSKNPTIQWDVPFYTITAESRGKEMKLWLEEYSPKEGKEVMPPQKISILFRFGMSGCFKLSIVDEIPKHSHLRFFTAKNSVDPKQVLSFVDFRRFGKWEVNVDWGSDRGPCPITDYENFRHNIVNNLENSAFKNKAICEVLLNQKYFNGIGNYLRAEILFRSKIAPFDDAYNVLCDWKHAAMYPIKTDNVAGPSIQDPLYLCHAICSEVLKLSVGYGVEAGLKENGSFEKWLRCYQNPRMKSLTDRNKRTIWFDGVPGPLVPNDSNTRRPKTKRRIVENVVEKSVTGVKARKRNTVTESTELRASSRIPTRRSPRFAHVLDLKEMS
ncbi:endonuclease 8-like 1 isoform X2 [Daphnia magna]|uniref:endonuclease 8-like 1 isoform X2 n=1 Tax=Daphnia magna TaxID=35525 RepID=UPI0006EA1300|nr:endonuclease 8-like 1 isoform X2 [Daphnia magna]